MFYSADFDHFSMAEVEAICAKLQSKPIRTFDDRNNPLAFPATSTENPNDEFNFRRRKRKTNVPRFITNIAKCNSDMTMYDRSCGALDLSVNQPSPLELEEVEEIINIDNCNKNTLVLPTFLQNPLMNIFMNNRDIHENFKSILSTTTPYDFSAQKNPQSLTNSDSKSDEEIKTSFTKIHDSEGNPNNLITSQNIDKEYGIKDKQSSPGDETPEECIKRFSSYEDCKDEQCRQSLLRDHFHCIQCKKIIMRREEMIRHSKWHKKREESLQFNFMRFSPGDDCKEFMCSYNGRQTHYHCLHLGCNKIYISTSDVQMHSNFHKKDAAINQEGFQRYRATELCCIPTCSYNNQRTTHFHCMRENCKFTFKNKADMDKHKGHHQRNDTLCKEGFRKYIKYEHCDFNGCKFSKLMNHIHCIRSNCDYVVHSSAQINSHRRKHERRILTTGTMIPSDNKSDTSSILNLSKNPISLLNDTEEGVKPETGLDNEDSRSSVIINPYSNNCQFISQLSIQLKDWENSSEWLQETRRFTANDPCVAHCGLLYKDHYHCLFVGCNVAFKVKEKIRDHCRRHKIDSLLLQSCYESCNDVEHLNAQNNGPNKSHYHCKWTGCTYLRVGPDLNSESTIDFNFLQEIYDHFDFHESRFHLLVNKINKILHNSNSNSNNNIKTLTKQSSDDSSSASDIYLFNTELEKNDSFYINAERKRGRPPKYKKNIHIPKIELNDEEMNDDETIMDLTKDHFTLSQNGIKCGFKFYSASNVFCADDMCMYFGRSEHFHCLRQRCHHATDSITAVNLHRREFHHYMQIDVGYEYFDRSINCRRSQCQNNRVNNHYHCVRLNCDYSFKRFNTMHQHTRKHVEIERQKAGSSHTLEESGPVISTTQQVVDSPLVTSSNYSASALLSDYSRSFNTLFSFPQCPTDHMFYHPQENINLPIIPSLPTNAAGSLTSNMNLNSLINFNNTISPFHNSFKSFINNNTTCYPLFPQPPSKMPRF